MHRVNKKHKITSPWKECRAYTWCRLYFSVGVKSVWLCLSLMKLRQTACLHKLYLDSFSLGFFKCTDSQMHVLPCLSRRLQRRAQTRLMPGIWNESFCHTEQTELYFCLLLVHLNTSHLKPPCDRISSYTEVIGSTVCPGVYWWFGISRLRAGLMYQPVLDGRPYIWNEL